MQLKKPHVHQILFPVFTSQIISISKLVYFVVSAICYKYTFFYKSWWLILLIDCTKLTLMLSSNTMIDNICTMFHNCFDVFTNLHAYIMLFKYKILINYCYIFLYIATKLKLRYSKSNRQKVPYIFLMLHIQLN